jgi:glycosyltransferase involved in cell wall biosynthesis
VASEAGRHRRVRYLGVLEGTEKDAQLAGCRALVAPALWWEPLGMVLYEAYDHSKPVLAARSGGMTELVLDGETGWLHEPGAVDQLAEQIMSLDADPARAAEMGRRGRIWLEENARSDQWLQQVQAVLDSVKAPIHSAD